VAQQIHFLVPLRSPIVVIGRSCDDNVDNSFGGDDGSIVESVESGDGS
jgi:hypothetical protein